MGQLREPWSRFGFLFLSSPCGCAQVFKNSSKALSYLLLSAKKCFFTNNIHSCSVTAALVGFIFGALTSFGVFVLAEVTLTTCCWSWSLCKNTLLITGRDRGGKLGFVSASGVCGEAMQTVQSKNDVHIDLFVGKNLQATVDSLIFCAHWINVKSNKAFLLRRNKLMVFLCFKCYSDNTHSSYLGAKRLQ